MRKPVEDYARLILSSGASAMGAGLVVYGLNQSGNFSEAIPAQPIMAFAAAAPFAVWAYRTVAKIAPAPTYKAKPQRWTEFAHTIQVPALSSQADAPPPSIDEEGYVFSGLGLDYELPESVLRRYCDIGVRRSIHYRYADKGLLSASSQRIGKMKATQVLSSAYFLKDVSPTFTPPQIEACQFVLISAGCLLNKRQGYPGDLRYENAGKMVRIAKYKWMRRKGEFGVSPTPKKFFGVSLQNILPNRSAQ